MRIGAATNRWETAVVTVEPERATSKYGSYQRSDKEITTLQKNHHSITAPAGNSTAEPSTEDGWNREQA